MLVFLTMCLCCACAALYTVVWDKFYQNTTWYLAYDATEFTALYGTQVFFQAFGTWILLFTNMVPISLLVSLEIVKFWQALFIGWDTTIYREEIDMPTKVQSSNLNEELG